MKRGPKPKPYALKVFEGNRGHRKLTPGLELPASRFEPPFELDGIARAEWDRIIGIAFWLRESEAFAVADRCLCWQRIQEAEQTIERMGLLVKTAAGEKPNPCVKIASFYRASMAVWDRELGLKFGSNEWTKD